MSLVAKKLANSSKSGKVAHLQGIEQNRIMFSVLNDNDAQYAE